MREEEEEYKKQHEYESPIKLKPIEDTSTPGDAEFVIT